MAKLTLSSVANLNNQTSAVNTINANSDLIETAIENTLSRDGTSPNAMGANLDMDGNRITNVSPIPLTGAEAASKFYVDFVVGNADLGDLPAVGDDVSIVGDLTVGDDATVTGDLAVGATLTVTGNTTLNDLTVGDDLTVTDDAAITGDLTVSGAANLVNLTLSGDLTVDVTPTGGNTADSIDDLFARFLFVEDFGAVGDGTTNDTTAIQAAIDAAEAAGGGTLFLKAKTYSVTDLTIDSSGVALIGTVSGRMFSVSASQTGTILKARSGTTNLLTVASASNASSTIASVRVENLVLDGNAIATRSLFIKPVTNSVFRNLVCLGSSTSQIETTCYTSGGSFTGLDYVYQCAFENVWVNAGTGSAKGIVLSGEPAGAGGNRTVFCMFRQIHITHTDGTALEINDADDNSFMNLAVSRNVGGTGVGIDLIGNDSDTEDLVHGNLFYFAHAGPGGWRSTGSKAINNWVFGLATEDGVPVSISSGAKLHYFKDDGFSNTTWHVFAASAVAASHTGNTTETTLATIALPAGAMGPNGILRITSFWTTTNNGNAKTPRIYLGGTGGTTYNPSAITNFASLRSVIHIMNRNSESSQVGSVSGAGDGGLGLSTSALKTGTIDTANAQDILFRGQLATGTDTITLESYIIEVLQRE